TVGSFFFNTGTEWQNMVSTTVSTAPALSTSASWLVSGNSGIDPANQFIGTTDSKALRFRINNIPAGELNPFTGNVSLGLGAGYRNTTGVHNVAIGESALGNSTNGNYNTANGSYTLEYNTTGFFNTANGSYALRYNSTGYNNTAVGGEALAANTDGQYNTAVGAKALINTGSSFYNTAVGYHTSLDYHVGWNNTFIGANSGVTSDDLYNCIAIGYYTLCNASKQVRIGNSSTTSIGGYAQWTNFSDGRYKKNIKEDVKGLDFILKLRPVIYQLIFT